MQKFIKKYFEAELSDEEDKNVLKFLRSEDSADGDMSKAFKNFKNSNSYSKEKNSPKPAFWKVAAVITLLAGAWIVFDWLAESSSEEVDYSDWDGMTTFERIGFVNQLNLSDVDQDYMWKAFQKESQINVKMALLRILESESSKRLEIQEMIENESSPLVRSTLIAMNQ